MRSKHSVHYKRELILRQWDILLGNNVANAERHTYVHFRSNARYVCRVHPLTVGVFRASCAGAERKLVVKPRAIKYPSRGNQLGMLFDTRDSASLFGFHVLQTGTAVSCI